MIVATDCYDQLTKFYHPWEYWIQDNFLDNTTYEQLVNLKHSSDFEVVDGSNGAMAFDHNHKNVIAKKYKILIDDNHRLYKKIQENVNKINQVECDNLTVNAEFIKCEPGYCYHKHTDHIDKKVTIVVFIDPDQCDATTLFRDKEEYEIMWRPNRALFFIQGKSLYHMYKNCSEADRFTLNIFLMAEKARFKTKKLRG